MKLSKNTLLLGAAVVLGVGCFAGARIYLNDYLKQAERKLAGSYETTKVIVAAVDVPAGGSLSPDNLAVRTIPKRYLASTVMLPENLEVVTGQKVMVALKAGDPIDRGALERGDHAALSTTVAKGERAITVPVDEISSLSGMLVPGDMIDLLYTGPGTTSNSYDPTQHAGAATEASAAPKELIHVRLLLQSVVVMATGKTTQKRVVRVEGGGQQEVNVDFSTVTLKVTSAQAQQVLIAQKLGQLTAVLRNPDDRQTLGKMVLDETSFKRVQGPPAVVAANYVETIIGGTGVAGGARSQSLVGKDALSDLISRLSPVQARKEAAASNAFDVRDRLGIPASVQPASYNLSVTPPAGADSRTRTTR